MQCGHDRPGKETHEAEFDTKAVIEVILVCFAKTDDLAHVSLVEGGEHGGGLLCHHKPFGNTPA